MALSRWLEGLSAEGKLLAAHGLNRLVFGIMVHLVEFSEDTDTAMSLGSQLGWWLPRLVELVGSDVNTDHYSFMVKLLQLVKQNNATTTNE
jgi:hypothetical protein